MVCANSSARQAQKILCELSTRRDWRLTAVIVFGLTAFGLGSAWATVISPLDAPHLQGTGEILEPSGSFVVINEPESLEPAALQAVPEPSFEVYENLARQISESQTEYHSSLDSFYGLETASEAPTSLATLEWAQHLAETGFWLENDQWADFRAIALASYLPEIRYWLGRDRWSAFGSLSFGGNRPSGLSESASSDGPSRQSYTSATGYNVGSSGSGDGRGKSKDRRLGEASTYELLISMLETMAKQPLFYLGLVIAAGVVLVAMRRQSGTRTSSSG